MITLYDVRRENRSGFLLQPWGSHDAVAGLAVAVDCSRDFETVLTACLDDGFRWLTNQTVEYFKPHASNGMTPA